MQENVEMSTRLFVLKIDRQLLLTGLRNGVLFKYQHFSLRYPYVSAYVKYRFVEIKQLAKSVKIWDYLLTVKSSKFNQISFRQIIRIFCRNIHRVLFAFQRQPVFCDEVVRWNIFEPEIYVQAEQLSQDKHQTKICGVKNERAWRWRF